MLTQTLQGALQAEIRAATGKTNQDFNGDLHDLCTIYGVPMAPISGRIIPVAQIFDSSINSSASALNYLLKNATTVVGPRGLFASGEQGAWYDPSDLTTLFQDSAGTTPVTAVEQPVGLVLDKSKGLVLGPELLADPGFDNAGSWETSAGVTITGGEAVWNTAGTSVYVRQPSIIAANSYYEFTIVCSSYTSGSVLVALGAGGSTLPAYPIDKVGTVTFRYNVGVNSGRVWLLTPAGGAQLSITSFSVKLIAGNHAYQTTSASRPTLRARYNLLTYSEQFDNGVYNKNGTTVSGADINATTAPDGTVTADRVRNTATTGNHDVYASITTIAATYTFSAYLKADGVSWACLVFQTPDGTNRGCFFDLANGVRGTEFNSATGSISPVSGATGWYRCVVTATAATAGTSYPLICVATANGSGRPSYLGDTSQTIFAWGAQLTQTAVFPSNTYQQITTATSYATGAAFPPYLFFDGVDDSLLTNSVDFSATDKMTVWVGVTKSSDAATGLILETSANFNSNQGSIAFFAPDPGGPNYAFGLNGTFVTALNATTFASPITSVLSCGLNIAETTRATEITPRVNAAIPTLTGAGNLSAGTGNFGNYPLYIGRRNNATLPLNGNIYSLIIRGAQSTAAQISSTESWVAAKTPLGSL